MHVLIISPYFFPEQFKINDIATTLVSKGHRVTVLTGLPNYPAGKFFSGYSPHKGPWKETWQGVTVLRFPMIPRGSGSSLEMGLSYLSQMLSMALLGPFRKEIEDIDVQFAFGLSPNIVSITGALIRRMHDKPFGFWLTDVWPDSITATTGISNPLIIKPVTAVVEMIYDSSDVVFYSSPGFEKHLDEFGIEQRRIQYLPQYPETIFKPAPKPAWNLPGITGEDSGFNIMYTGNIGKAQSMPTVMEAARILATHSPFIRWYFIGDGSMESWAKEYVETHGLQKNVFFLGRKPIETIPEWTSLADAMLLSLTDTLIFSWVLPTKLQSYMASGKPVIVSANGSAASIIESAEAGVAASAEDVGSLVDAVLSLAKLPKEELADMGDRADRYCQEHFSKEGFFSKLENAFESMLRNNR